MFDQNSFDIMPRYNLFQYQFIFDFAMYAWVAQKDKQNVAAIRHTSCPSAVEAKDHPESYDKVFLYRTNDLLEDMHILSEFEMFTQRPEYKLLYINIPKNLAELRDYYSELLAGAVFTRAASHIPGCNPDDAWPQIQKCLKWLDSTDFFHAPASSRFHDCYAGGLCFHSLKVAQRCVDLMKTNTFGDPNKLGDAVFCSLVHDWCKINLYESYQKNVKDDNTGKWTAVTAYRYGGNSVVSLGHGVSSMFMASKFFRLNEEEATAIRWHMGAYRVADSDFGELQESNEKYMLVHLLQFADQLSLVNY